MKNSIKKPLSLKKFYRMWGKKLELVHLKGTGKLNGYIKSWEIGKIGSGGNNRYVDGGIHVLTVDQEKKSGNTNNADYEQQLLNKIEQHSIPCLVTGHSADSYDMLFRKSSRTIPVFETKHKLHNFVNYATRLLRDELVPFKTLHGVLIDIHRLGVLITGKSGVGKSESALDLINKGSRLIADDVIMIRNIDSKAVGTGPDRIKYLMEIRGVGIVNIKELYGTSSVMNERQIDLVIELDHWDQNKEYDRLGYDIKTLTIVDVEIPYLLIPVSPGRNTSTIIELAVRNQLAKLHKSIHDISNNDEILYPGEGRR